MSYNGSGTFQINTTGQPVVAGTVISSTAFNALTADLATGLSTAITKDGQTATTARIPFAAGISSTLVTDSTSVSTGSIITAGGMGVAKALFVGTTANIAGVLSTTSPNITTSITTPSTSFDLINATATTLNLGGAATAFNVGAATGTMTVANTTLAAKAITASTTLGVTGAATLSSTLTYGGVTLTNAVTGTGKMVLDTSPTLITPILGVASATSVLVGSATKLNVTGGATGTGTVTFAAPVTSTNRTLTLPDNTGTVVSTGSTAVVSQAMLATNVASNGPAFSAYKSTSQTLSSTTFTKILFETEDYDTNSNFASSTFTPTVAGYYQINAAINIATSATQIILRIYKNGTTYRSGTNINSASAVSTSSIVYCNGSTDYIEIYGFLGSGQALATGQSSCYFDGAIIRAA